MKRAGKARPTKTKYQPNSVEMVAPNRPSIKWKNVLCQVSCIDFCCSMEKRDLLLP